jgi:GWxTD domain-containing protein
MIFRLHRMKCPSYRTAMFYKPLFFWLGAVFCCSVALQTPLCGQVSLQQAAADQRSFFMDALCFKGSDTAQRVDVYTIVPHQSLTFVKRGAQYIAAYRMVISLKGKDGKELQQITKEYPIAEEKFEATTGSSGAFAYAQNILSIPPGTYTVEVRVADILGKHTMQRVRTFTTIDFDKYDLSMSSLMFSSAITQSGQRYAVTPYLDDDIAPLGGDAFYAFFETYFHSLTADSVDFAYEILDARGKRALLSKRTRRLIKGERLQQYIKVEVPTSFAVGTYMLRVLALKPDTTVDFKQSDVLTAAQRSVVLEWKGLGYGILLQGEELNRAIRQMRYATTTQDVNAILAAPNEEEKQKRFYEFWKRSDPTPKSPRNEGYEEYYTRIDFATRTFRHYSEGWMTDMGMVYVIYGQPTNASEQRRIDGRTMVSWYYASVGREFVFIDSGFGDFRLMSPPPIEKYRFRR